MGLARALFAGVAELVDALDLGSSAARRGGSNPSARTRPEARHTNGLDDAGHGYKRGWTEARIEDSGSRSGSRKQTRRKARRDEEPGAPQGVPPRQGAVEPSAQDLRQAGHGRGHSGDWWPVEPAGDPG